MKKTDNKRMISIVLAVVMILSNIPVAVFAQNDTYCGLEHEHEEACYIAPAEETPAEEETNPPTETTTEATEEETEPDTTPATQEEPVVESSVQISGNVPETVSLTVTEQEAQTAYDDGASKFVSSVEKIVCSFDITPADAEGNLWQPAEGEKVAVTFDLSDYEVADGTMLYALHHLGDGTIEHLGMAQVTEGKVTFYTDGFSVITVIKREFAMENALEDVIYFDLRAGDVSITENTYTGYRYDGGNTAVKVTGNHVSGQHYYVYQSAKNQYDMGIYDTDNDGVLELHLPVYDPVQYNGMAWGDYITNHPTRSTQSNKAYSDKDVTNAWVAATKNTTRTYTENRISITTGRTSATEFNLTIDNIWSSKHTSGVDVGLRFSPLGTYKTLNLVLKGDNRLARLHCAIDGGTNGKYTEDTGHTSLMTFAADPSDPNATLTICNPTTTTNATYTAAAIGGTDSIDHTVKLFFNSGTIYAANGGNDFGTAIGGGGNGDGRVTINGGRITALASSTGTAIGGGCGTSGPGGYGEVTITGGEVYAYNYKPCGRGSDKFANALPTAIGGGSSGIQIGGKGIVCIKGGYVYAYSQVGVAIGGGGGGDGHHDGSGTQKAGYFSATGGVADVTLSGGTIDAISGQGCAIGGGPGGGEDYGTYSGVSATNLPTDNLDTSRKVSANGGTCKLTITGNPIVRTGSIGGGSPLFPEGSDENPYGFTIGAAVVNISGGTTHGQVVMQGQIKETGGISGLTVGASSSFTMTGGIINNESAQSKSKFVKLNGGAVFIGSGNATMTGGTIQNCTQINGNPITYGGALYVLDGSFTMTGGTVENCTATNGGAVYVDGGNVSVSGGTITYNTAENGGAVYVNGGDVHISGQMVGEEMGGGKIIHNTANVNGGGIAVNNGEVYMSGGHVSNNTATTGEGGGIYVSSSGTNDVSVKVYSGVLENNTAALNGGAVAVRGESGNITVQTGVNHDHYPEGVLTYGFEHTEDEGTYTHQSCPQIRNNSSDNSGGAFYIYNDRTQNTQGTTRLNIYCLTGEGNNTKGDLNPLNENMSNFMMVEGGTVYLSTSTHYQGVEGQPGVDSPEGDDKYGHMLIHGSIHVVSGVLELFGSKDNPRLEGALTIDLQSNDDKYIDHRGSEDKLTISYHENFYRPDGTPDSAQTAFDIQAGQKHTIYSGLYAHEGYKFHGWNLNKDADVIATTDGWYDANAEYIFRMADDAHPEGTVEETDEGVVYYGNLTLYAIWKVNGYFVKFVPGVPEDQEWTGEAWTDTYTYDVERELPENWFVWPGHVFAGWKLPDGTVKQPGDMVKNLTTENAATVEVVAQWIDCEHPDANQEYTSNGTDTLTRTCNLCGLSATAKLTAQDAVYDGNSHEAKLECSDATFWNPTIDYVGYTIKPQDAPDDWTTSLVADPRVSAGDYTATISQDDLSISVQYTIAKAKQAAPKSRPTYVQPTDKSDIVTINLLPTGEQESSESGAEAVYYIRYYENGVETTEKAVDNDTETAGIQHKLTKVLKTYAVLAGYPETDDYLASSLISAESTFVFAGKLHLTIKAEDGIDFWPGDVSEQQMAIYVKLQDGYYLEGNDFTFEKEVIGGTYNEDDVKVKKDETDTKQDNRYFVEAVNANDDAYVTITIGGVKKIASIEGCAKEKQHFSDFAADANPVISRDSAFTMRFDITAYDTEVYREPVLRFTSSGAAKQLPAGTTIILRDRSNGSYWYTKLGSAASAVELGDFRKMDSGNSQYAARTGDLKLQFIVDFSQAVETINGTSLTCTMAADTEKQDSNAEALSASVTVGLANSQLTLGAVTGGGLTQSIGFVSTFGGAASKYDHRDVALVLTPQTALPKDASIWMELNGAHTVWRPDKDGRIIISLGNFRSLNTNIVLELNSSMFPMAETEYVVKAQLYLSGTDAELAPMNGNDVGEAVLRFTSSAERTGVQIAVDRDQRIFTTADDITAAITVTPEDYAGSYNLVVELHQELDGNTFGDTTIKPQSSGGTYTFDLAGRPTGDYCIVVSLQTRQGYVLNEARYYFIVQPAANSGN